MDSRVRRKSESESQERGGSQTKQYTRNIQRIFNNESNFRFRHLENYDEDKELLSPTESEHDDLLGLGVNLLDAPAIPRDDQGTPDSVSLKEGQKELIIIDTDVSVAASARRCEPPPLTLQPVTRKYTGIASSPYKDVSKSKSKSMSPENIDFCPNNWFEVKKDVEQEGFCQQVSWKCCFLCVCLPLCYPCYLTRTVRAKLKADEKSAVREDCLVAAGQQELHSAYHHINLVKTHHEPQSRGADTNNVNVIILQSNSASRLIRELQEKKVLETESLDLTPDPESEESSPVVLRRTGGHHKSLTGNQRKSSKVFYSLESNLDEKSPVKFPLPTTISEVQSNIVSSLPSMTSGRFFSANSSVFSGVSSPVSDLSPSKDNDDCGDHIDKIGDTDHETVDHIEPIVAIVDHLSNSGESINRKSAFETGGNNITFLESEKKNLITSLNCDKSFLKKSVSVSSRCESITKICHSNQEFSLEAKRPTRERGPGVKFSSVDDDTSSEVRKYSSLPARQRLTNFKSHKLGLKQLGLHRTENTNNCPAMSQHFYEEGELSGWSTKDIYDIVSKDLPRMDIVVMVVNQDEKKVIEKTLARTTGVVGYIREYWSGFFPLLLIELTHKNGETDLIQPKSAVAIQSLFSVTHRIIVNNFDRNIDFILESVARFYNHIKVFQCEKFQQTLHTHRLGHLVSLSLTEKFWFCSGLCQMRVSRKKDEEEGNSRGALGLFQTVRRTIRSKYNFEDSETKVET